MKYSFFTLNGSFWKVALVLWVFVFLGFTYYQWSLYENHSWGFSIAFVLMMIALFIASYLFEQLLRIGLYGYATLLEEVNLNRGFMLFVWLCSPIIYFLLIIIAKLVFLILPSFYVDFTTLNKFEVANYPVFKNFIYDLLNHKVTDAKTQQLLNWLVNSLSHYKNLFQAKSHFWLDNYKVIHLQNHSLEEVKQYSLFSSHPLDQHFAKQLIIHTGVVHTFINSTFSILGRNFIVSNIFFMIQYLTLIKTFTFISRRFLLNPTLDKLQFRFESKVFNLLNIDTEIGRKINAFLGKEPFEALITWVIVIDLVFSPEGFYSFLIRWLGALLSWLIVKGKVNGKIPFYLIVLIIVPVFTYILELLHLFYLDKLSLREYPLDILYKHVAICLFGIIYGTFENHDKLQEEKYQDMIKQKDLENSLVQAQLDQQRLESQALSAQLSSLKNQLNSHFIFNSFSFIQNSVRPLSTSVAEAVGVFANIMRYNIEGATKDESADDKYALTVELENEIAQIENYIKFNRLRKEYPIFINFEIEGPVRKRRILPLLLVNYVENAIKYGIINDPRYPIDIRLKVVQTQLTFYVRNKKDHYARPVSTGVGNDNTQQRLLLVYPNTHTLLIKDETDFYTVSLQIDL